MQSSRKDIDRDAFAFVRIRMEARSRGECGEPAEELRGVVETASGDVECLKRATHLLLAV